MATEQLVNGMVIGAAGGIGRTLSTLLASANFVKKLVVCDVAPTLGIAAELCHMESGCLVKSQDVAQCDSDIDFVVLVCGKPQTSPNEKRDDLFKFNARIYHQLMTTLCARLEKDPIIVVVGNPVNSLTVVCAEALAQQGRYNPAKLFGFNELDAMRAQRFVAESVGEVRNSTDFNVPIIGGHSERTITPVLSKVTRRSTGKPVKLDEKVQERIFDDVRFAGDRILEKYENRGTAILSTAYSTYRFVSYLYSGKLDNSTVYYSYVEHHLANLPRFFTVPLRMDRNGVREILPVQPLIETLSEEKRKELIKEVNNNIQVAMDCLADIK